MRTQEIRHAIKRAIQEEQRTEWLFGNLRKAARRNGSQPDNAQLTQVMATLVQYVEAVPDLLEEVSRAANKAGWGDTVDPLIEVIEEYFFTSSDLIPDRLGLGGLLDDAYLALGVMQAISDHVQSEEGKPLLRNGLGKVGRMDVVVRQIMPPEVIEALDQKIEDAMDDVWVPEFVGRVHNVPSALPLYNDPHPYWGNASTDQIINMQLGVLGIF